MNKLQKVKEALERVLIGGNHLATVLIKNVGADFADKCPPDMEHEDALRILCATDEYEIWCCWNAIMNAREARAELNEFMEECKRPIYKATDDIDIKHLEGIRAGGIIKVESRLDNFMDRLESGELTEAIARELWETAQDIQDDDKWRTMSFDPTREECFMLAKRVQAVINVIKGEV